MRFIQIAVAMEAENGEVLYALGDDGIIYERASVYYSPGGTYQGNYINRGRVYTSPFWRKVELPFTEPPLEESKQRMLEITYNPKPEEA